MRLDDNQRTSPNESAKKEDHVSDFNYSLRYIRCLLRFIGIWPLVVPPSTKIEYIMSKYVLLPLVSISMMSLTMPLCYYVITRPIGRLETILLVGPITNLTSNILVHIVMILRSSLIKTCIEHVKLDWQRIENSKEHDIMRRYLRLSHALAITCMFIMYFGTVSYGLVMPLLSGNTINEMNETIRPRPFPGTEIFFDVQANLVYEIVFFINFISSLHHNTVAISVSVLAILFVSHAWGQSDIVMANLDSFIHRVNANEVAADSITKQMGFIIRRHVRLLKFATNIEKTLREILLLEVVATTLVICFIEYDVLVILVGILESDDGDRMGILSYVSLFTAFCFNLFLYCQFGEVLKGQCEKVGKKAYMVDWSGLPGRTKLALIMIMNISNYPYKLTAGGMMELSIVNFASIIKTSFAYFNMIRAMD